MTNLNAKKMNLKMRVTFVFVVVFLLVSSASAAMTQIDFMYDSNLKQVFRWDATKKCPLDEETQLCKMSPLVASTMGVFYKHVRIGIVDPVRNSQGKIEIANPYFIIDGINLKPEGKSLKDFEGEVFSFEKLIENEDGTVVKPAGKIIKPLLALGYTPILTQFAFTTAMPLSYNAEVFAAVLDYFAHIDGQGKLVWEDKIEQGFQILGISQGGVLGRYGAYLYDSQYRSRTKGEPGINLFTSLDSPHQGASVPRGILATVDFWGRERSQDAAKVFLDVLSAPGASQLLIYEMDHTKEFAPNLSSSRWLFGEYRNAANYKGFPAALISNGQIDGQKNNSGTTTVYKLNRWAEKGKSTWGRAISRIFQSDNDNSEYAYNREYRYGNISNTNERKSREGSTAYDLIQGSTYPFFGEVYSKFEAAFLKVIKNRFEEGPFDFYGKWEEHTKYIDDATFIPTTSSIDLLCNGDLSIKNDCAHTQTGAGINWENPGTRSTAKAIYAVDASHPGSTTANSGKHIQGATKTLDLWRMFCELSKSEWDDANAAYRNPNLAGKFNAGASCMDPNGMSPWFTEFVAPSGTEAESHFPWARWAYNANKVDKQFPVAFKLPAGWNTVATFDQGLALKACDVIHLTMNTEAGFSSNWLKAEIVLSTQKTGAGWWQFGEKDVAVDGQTHHVYWQLPCSDAALKDYRWMKLILNSLGGNVNVSDVYITNSSNGVSKPPPVDYAYIVPLRYGNWNMGTWGAHDLDYADSYGKGIKLNMPKKDDGAYWDAEEYKDLSFYKKMSVTYWPGTCQNTWVYFDKRSRKYDPTTGTYRSNAVSLAGGAVSGNFLVKTIPLTSIIDQEVTPMNTLSAQRLYAQTLAASESCIIKTIEFIEE